MTQTCALVVLGARGRCSAVALNARATTACALVVVMGVRRRRRHRAGDLGARGRWPHRPCSRGGPVVHACAGWPRRIMLLHVAAPYRAHRSLSNENRRGGGKGTDELIFAFHGGKRVEKRTTVRLD